MAGIGRGRLPEPDRSVVRNRKVPLPNNDIPNVPFEPGKKRMLPPLTQRQDPLGEGWPIATYNWWRALRIMPHCKLWSETDWHYAITTAWIHRRIWQGDHKLAGELRQRERAMGCTDEARRGLRIRYVDPEPEASVTPLHAVEETADTPPPAKPTRRVRAVDPASVGSK